MLSNYLNTYSPSPSLASGYNFSKKRGGGATALNTGYALRRCAPRPSAHWPSLRYGQRRIAWERYVPFKRPVKVFLFALSNNMLNHNQRVKDNINYKIYQA